MAYGRVVPSLGLEPKAGFRGKGVSVARANPFFQLVVGGTRQFIGVVQIVGLRNGIYGKPPYHVCARCDPQGFTIWCVRHLG